MFTGIVQGVGRVVALESCGGDLRVTIEAPLLAPADLAIGESIAVSGVCLTVVAQVPGRFSADVSSETLARTSLSRCAVGAAVNLERALRLCDRIGGHLVSGHVDGIATVSAIAPDARAQRWRFAHPRALQRYLAAKGSVCLDGVSLTVNEVDDDGFTVALIPHTIAVTTFASRGVGDGVNIEVDLIARYLEGLVARVHGAGGQ